MFIHNNSKKEWKQYHVGNEVYVDIKPETTFEVSDKVGRKLLSLLGAPQWLVKVSKPEVKPKKVVKKKTKKK